MASPILSISDAVKTYGDTHALNQVNLDVAEGEFLTLLGPSGSGKTTLLSAIAGFIKMDSGKLTLRAEDITNRPPEHRDFGMVFQGYALFPTMTVRENVAFPLKVRKKPSSEITKRVNEALEMVQMGAFADRMPSQLSGGQQQRIALARAMSFSPQVLLLDEPLSALDKKLRADLQWELKALHNQLGVTFIYVTHDQDEALSMSDRIIILKDGGIQQQGDPNTLYNRPRNKFVADFLGKSNFIDVTVKGQTNSTLHCTAQDVAFDVETDTTNTTGDTVKLALRPERLKLGAPNEEFLPAVVKQVSYLGERCQVIVTHKTLGEMLVSCPTWKTDITPVAGLTVSIGWEPDAPVVLADN
ncbi:putative spermidine/putrescine transport system ATP-binding protein [Sulfitobacter undariae]|uniref:Spermidine/putrescine import ATP-binding protein PotA n=1 Tax=Sulfitobacter undariae TaxID=1563671 RepID=A0A7W6H2R5_9RHOB|nr:ABC transporter ATP-binding protein [Sulfitobacter undariae]MBB3995119.1 putative spermidine/putrescine transport system ATP-binding protein [Sulfitobacter undariae]